MRGDATGKPPADPHEPRGQPQHASARPRSTTRCSATTWPTTCPPEDLARVEKALRDSAELRARLEDVRNNREDVQLHTLGAIWHRCRLTCPSRQQLGSYLLDALDPELAAYFKFHLEVVECPFCQANLADLEAQAQGRDRPPGLQDPPAPHPQVEPAPARRRRPGRLTS